jgi:hypothetical protein
MNSSTDYDALLDNEPDFDPYLGICPKNQRKKIPAEMEHYLDSLM